MKGKPKAISIFIVMMCCFLSGAFSQSAEAKIDTAAIIIKSYGDELPPYKADPETEELSFLLRQNYTFGTIYFSGKGFRYVTFAGASSYSALRPLLIRCQQGTVISFEYCVYKKPDGKKVGPISKSFTVK